MLPPEAVQEAITDAQQHLVILALDIAAGSVPPGAAAVVQGMSDTLTCLLDEAPEEKHPEIEYLIERCEAVAKRLAN